MMTINNETMIVIAWRLFDRTNEGRIDFIQNLSVMSVILGRKDKILLNPS